MAGEKPMSDVKGNGGPKGARLQKAVAELQEVSKVFPAVASMIEGLQGAREAAVEEVLGELNALRSKMAGISKVAADIEINAKNASADADRVARAELALQETGRSLEEKATGAASSAAEAKAAAQEVQTAISTLKIKVGEKEYAGADALGILATVISRIPERISREVERVVSAEVTDDGGKTVKLSGAELLSHLATDLKYVKVAAGQAVSDADHATELLERATELVGEAQSIASQADEKLAEAQAEIANLKSELADARKDTRYMFGMFVAMMKANGLNTEITEEIDAAGNAEAEGSQDDS